MAAETLQNYSLVWSWFSILNNRVLPSDAVRAQDWSEPVLELRQMSSRVE